MGTNTTDRRVGPGTLWVMVGGIASGKTTVARHLATQVIGDKAAHIEADGLRAQLFGDAAIQGNPADIARLAHDMARIRLQEGRSVVYDATNLVPKHRKTLVELAQRAGADVVAVWTRVSEETARGRNQERDRVVPEKAFTKMTARANQVRAHTLTQEGFEVIEVDAEEGDPVSELDGLAAIPDGWEKTSLDGPFDVIGDVHGCLHTLQKLMARLGYNEDGYHPEGRTLVSVGDIVDRGAWSWDSWNYVARLTASGRMIVVQGNHESKHSRYLEKMVAAAETGEDAKSVIAALREAQGGANGLTAALEEAYRRGSPGEWRKRAAQMRRLPTHVSLDGGALLICHGAARSDLIGRASGQDREATSWFLYGAPTGETTEAGHPIRADWQPEWDHDSFVVVGHSTVSQPRHVEAGGGTVNIDTGCAFGPDAVDVNTGETYQGYLTALRWPEARTDVEAALVTEPVDETDLS